MPRALAAYLVTTQSREHSLQFNGASGRINLVVNSQQQHTDIKHGAATTACTRCAALRISSSARFIRASRVGLCTAISPPGAATEDRDCECNQPRADPAIFFFHISISFRASVNSPHRLLKPFSYVRPNLKHPLFYEMTLLQGLASHIEISRLLISKLS